MKFLLDTTAFVDYLRGDKETALYLNQQKELFCSVITAAELLRGANSKQALGETKKLLARLHIFPVTEAISDIMLSLVKRYALSHTPQIPDAFIAATAIENDLVLVTSNIKHFSFIKDLKVSDWQDIKRELMNTA